MKDYIRLGGAQIPCTKDIDQNVKTLKDALTWASENNVDYLVTPEGSLSGYTLTFAEDLQKLKDALRQIENFAAEKKVGLFLGTLWVEDYDGNHVRRNQIRFYDKEGVLRGVTNKIILTDHDTDIGIMEGQSPNYMVIKEGDDFIPVGGFICNDLYGREGFPNLPNIAFINGVSLFVHSTNAERGKDQLYDSVTNDWHNAHLRIVSYLAGVPLITVDNSCLMDGEEWNGPTSSPSGVVIAGDWKVQAARVGHHYFYHDLPINKLLDRQWNK